MLTETCFFNTKAMFFKIERYAFDHRKHIFRQSKGHLSTIERASPDFLTSIPLQINLMILTKSSWFV